MTSCLSIQSLPYNGLSLDSESVIKIVAETATTGYCVSDTGQASYIHSLLEPSRQPFEKGTSSLIAEMKKLSPESPGREG